MNDSNEVNRTQNPSKSSKRQSLQSLQPISNNNKVLTRAMATTKRSDIKDKERSKSERITKWLTQKDSIDSDLKYWKQLAKEREKALKMTLKENQDLTEDNRRLKHLNEELIHEKELLGQENQHLSKLAEEGIKLKELIEGYIE